MNKNFVSDLEFENQLHAVLIRCFEAGVKILEIVQPELPVGVSFFSAKDLPCKNEITFLGESLCIFADDVTGYAGQPVGILVGPDKRQLQEIRALFTIKTAEDKSLQSGKAVCAKCGEGKEGVFTNEKTAYKNSVSVNSENSTCITAKNFETPNTVSTISDEKDSSGTAALVKGTPLNQSLHGASQKSAVLKETVSFSEKTDAAAKAIQHGFTDTETKEAESAAETEAISIKKTPIPPDTPNKKAFSNSTAAGNPAPEEESPIDASEDLEAKTAAAFLQPYDPENLKKEQYYLSRTPEAAEHLSSGDPDEVFKKSKNIITTYLSFKPYYHFHAETACVKTRRNGEKLEIYAATQWPFSILDSVCSALKLPKEKVNVILHKETESLDGRMWFPALLAVRAAIAACLTGKNISLVLSRQEDFLYAPKSPAVTVKYKSAVTDDGLIQASGISIMADMGSYNPFIKKILKQMTLTAAGIYRLPVYTINAAAVKSTKGLTGIFSGWGDSFVTAAVEKHMNEIAQALSLSPVKLRADNLLKTKQEKIYGEKKEESYKFENLFKTVCGTSGFFRKYYSYRSLNMVRKSRYDGNWRGMGIAAGLQYSGSNLLVKTGMNYSAEITLTKENKVIVKAEPSSSNLRKILKKLIAKELETEENQIAFLGGCTDNMNPTGADTASCGISILPNLIEKCCAGIKKSKFRKPLPITVAKTYKIPKLKDWNSETLKGSPFIAASSGVCAVELELEPSTYKLSVRGIWFACNPGGIYSKKNIIRNIHKSILNAVSHISVERSKSIIPSAFQFKIISANETPPVKIYLLENDAKPVGVDELAGGLVPAAYISALNQILLKHRSIDTVPVFPEDIFAASLPQEVTHED